MADKLNQWNSIHTVFLHSITPLEHYQMGISWVFTNLIGVQKISWGLGSWQFCPEIIAAIAWHETAEIRDEVILLLFAYSTGFLPYTKRLFLHDPQHHLLQEISFLVVFFIHGVLSVELGGSLHEPYLLHLSQSWLLGVCTLAHSVLKLDKIIGAHGDGNASIVHDWGEMSAVVNILGCFNALLNLVVFMPFSICWWKLSALIKV